MNKLKWSLPIYAVAVLVLASVAVAQDTDKDKLMAIEKTLAANPNPGPEAAALVKKHMYDAEVVQLTTMGKVGALPRARVVELSMTPDPSDPNAKTAETVSDFQVNIYGDTALVAYKQSNTDTGHKDPMLNISYRMTCLDTFVKSKGEWYMVGDACSPASPIPQATWDAYKKAQMQLPKDVQQAFH